MTETTNRPASADLPPDAETLGGLALPSLPVESRELLLSLSREEQRSGVQVSPEEHAKRLLARLGDESGWESSRVRGARRAIERFLEERGVRAQPRSHASDRRPALVREALEGRARLALSFGGQGAPYLEELSALYARSHRTRRLLDAVVERRLCAASVRRPDGPRRGSARGGLRCAFERSDRRRARSQPGRDGCGLLL